MSRNYFAFSKTQKELKKVTVFHFFQKLLNNFILLFLFATDAAYSTDSRMILME
jgi:hypothetical protein